MSPASWISVVTLSVAGFLAHCPTGADGHVYMMKPVSRNLFGTSAFDQSDVGINHCPHCFQSRGPAAVRARGGGAPWPHFNGERAANGNYIETDEVSKRHGICGDPEQTKEEGSNLYGMENINYPVLETYAEGEVLEVKIVVSTYHWGHVEAFICNGDDLAGGPDGTLTQSCFNKYPLDRAADDGDAGPIDPKNPGRYILDPPCRKGETDQEIMPGAFPGDVATARFQLPSGLTCKRCTVQMVYYTGNSCKHQGYEEFNPPSWPGSCAPNKADWINEVVGQCGDGDAYPEEFWNCADIEISSDGDSSPTPTTTDAPEGAPTSEAPTSEAPTSEAPTSEAPTSEAPTSEAPTSEAPTSEAPTSEAPTSEAPTSEAPTYDEAPTSAPMSEAPTSEAPVSPDSPEASEAPETPSTDGGGGGGENQPAMATFAPSQMAPTPGGKCSDPVMAYGQCGGDDYTGSTCCRPGYECESVADCFSECRPVENGCSEGWGQCGGSAWDGPTCCWPGAECLERSEWYHQCVPEVKE